METLTLTLKIKHLEEKPIELIREDMNAFCEKIKEDFDASDDAYRLDNWYMVFGSHLIFGSHLGAKKG